MTPRNNSGTKPVARFQRGLFAIVVPWILSSSVHANPGERKIDLAPGYRVDPTWPDKPPEYKWFRMAGIAVDAKDQIWTLNRGNMPVQVYRQDGKLVKAWGEGLFKLAHQIRIDHEGSVWIANANSHVVQKFTPAGQLLLTLGTPDEPGEDETHMNRPTDMAISPTGDVFVADGYGNNRIVHFDSRGRFVKAWGKHGIHAGELNLPHAIAMDSRGRLYVVERNNVRIQVFDQNGESLARWSNLINPWGICVTPDDHVLVCGSSPMRWTENSMLGAPPKDQMVIRFDRDGQPLELWTFPLARSSRAEPGTLHWAHGIDVDSLGNLYLGDVGDDATANFRAQKFIRLPSGVGHNHDRSRSDRNAPIR